MKTERLRGVVAVLCLALAACGANSTDGAGGAATTSGGANDPFAACTRGELEADLVTDPQLTGPGVDSKTHALAPGNYTIATTYLALVPSQAKHAQELGGAVVASLPKMKGLVAFSLASSSNCASLRTLTVWSSEEDMAAFVSSPAHAKAMTEIHTLSRGTSDVTSWEGEASDANWTHAAAELAKIPGAGL